MTTSVWPMIAVLSSALGPDLDLEVPYMTQSVAKGTLSQVKPLSLYALFPLLCHDADVKPESSNEK